MAETLRPVSVCYTSADRIVVMVTDHFEYLGDFRFAERVSFMRGYQIRVCSDGVRESRGRSRPRGAPARRVDRSHSTRRPLRLRERTRRYRLGCGAPGQGRRDPIGVLMTVLDEYLEPILCTRARSADHVDAGYR